MNAYELRKAVREGIRCGTLVKNSRYPSYSPNPSRYCGCLMPCRKHAKPLPPKTEGR